MATLAGFILVAAVAAVIALPLFRPAESSGVPAARPDESLQREKAVALLAIKEAQFDHATGKLADADYSLLRSEYEERAMRAIHGLEGNATTQKDETEGDETALALYCHHCGRRFDAADRFCSSCGTARLVNETPVG